jgi:hypothetical protein
MCYGITTTFRCCARTVRRYQGGRRCEGGCDSTWAPIKVRNTCKSCRRRNEEVAEEASRQLPQQMQTAKAVVQCLRGERSDPRTDERIGYIGSILNEARQAHFARHFRLHPFTDNSPYLNTLRERLDHEAQLACGNAFTLLRPQLFEECLRRQDQLSRGRAMTYEDQVSHLQVIINGIFLPQFAPLLQTQTPQFIVSPASELDQDHATALDKVTVCAGGPLSDPGLLSPLSSEKEEHTNQTSSEAKICFSFPQWCEKHKS